MRKPICFVVVPALAFLLAGCDHGDDHSREQGAKPVPPGAPVMQPASPSQLPQERSTGMLEEVATFSGAIPTGVAVSNEGRVFVNFPRWSDPIDTSVAEVKAGAASPYPDAGWNPAQPGDPAKTFVGVQSVVMDAKDRLWVLDTGTVNMGKVAPGAAKLVGFDLAKNEPFVTIAFGADVALPTSYLNDVRFDLKRGKAGFAYISDSSFTGSNAIVVVDLDSKKAWRRLVDHPSVKPAPGFLAIVEGVPLYGQRDGQPRAPFTAGIDGIEVSPDGKTVYYCPLASRRLYSVSADALSDAKIPDAQVAASVKDLGDKGASDGLLMGADGRLYATEYEGNAIVRRNLDGTWEPVAADPRMLWPDSMSVGPAGYLYVTANQLERQPMLRAGKDDRQKPYSLFRVKAGITR